MDITFFRFEVHGEPDNRRYELSIGFNEKPDVLERTGSNTGYYLNQVEFYLYEPEGTDLGYSFLITLHQHVNPSYDLAVQQLLGFKLSDIIQDTGDVLAISERDATMRNRGDKSLEVVLEELLGQRIDEAKASQVFNRILTNSTFL